MQFHQGLISAAAFTMFAGAAQAAPEVITLEKVNTWPATASA